VDAHKLKRTGHKLFHGKQEAAQMASPDKAMAIEWLRRQLLGLPTGTTLGEAIKMGNFYVPETPDGAVKALNALEKMEAQIRSKNTEIKQIKRCHFSEPAAAVQNHGACHSPMN
jgi:hypothetical protein